MYSFVATDRRRSFGLCEAVNAEKAFGGLAGDDRDDFDAARQFKDNFCVDRAGVTCLTVPCKTFRALVSLASASSWTARAYFRLGITRLRPRAG